MIIGIQAALTKLKAFTDSFTRTDNPSTLQGSGTKSWFNTRGTWAISSNKASTATAPATYPLASIKTGSTYATAKIGFGTASKHGWGVAFWLADNANWYGAVTDRTYVQTSYQTTYYTCSNGGTYCGNGYCSQPGIICGDYYTGSWCGGAACPACPAYAPHGGQVGWDYGTNPNGNPGCDAACTCGGSASANHPATGPLYQTNYVDNYTYFLNTIKSTANTISTLDNFTYIGTNATATSYLNYVQVSTDTPISGTVRLTYQLNNGSTLTRDVVVTSPAKAKSYGIIISPVNATSSGDQATNVDNFEYTPLP
jgi:hypothetical protein